MFHPDTHPIKSLVKILNNPMTRNQNVFLSLKTYKSAEYTHEETTIRVNQVQTVEQIDQVRRRAIKDHYDVAVGHILWVDAADTLYVPMIDFNIKDIVELRDVVDMFEVDLGMPASSWDFYSSGRSFHAYNVEKLLTFSEWQTYMAKLLLLSNPSGESTLPPVDSRWVGHALLHQNNGLRLTKVSPRYRKEPELVIL